MVFVSKCNGSKLVCLSWHDNLGNVFMEALVLSSQLLIVSVNIDSSPFNFENIYCQLFSSIWMPSKCLLVKNKFLDRQRNICYAEHWRTIETNF